MANHNLEEDAQWSADTERLLVAGLTPQTSDPFSGDEVTIEAVQQRCVEKYGPVIGSQYYITLLATLPDRRPELFPELQA